MHVTAIVLAAGEGRRLASKSSKPLVLIDSHPLCAYSLIALRAHPSIRELIVVVNPQNQERIARLVRRFKDTSLVRGGARRQDSVSNALRALSKKTGLVLIHDAARPFIDRRLIREVVRVAGDTGAAIAAVPMKATVKRVTGGGPRGTGYGVVQKTLKRDELWEVQTPQVFRRDIIEKAYARFGAIDATDDAMMVERLGVTVRVVMGSYQNIKVTTPEDLVIAEAIARNSRGLHGK